MRLLPRLPVRRPSPARPVRTALRVVAVAAVAGFAWESVRVLGLENRHAVIPGAFYRCAQPGESLLRREIEAHGIRTVVNLRGYSPDTDWYAAEARATHDRNVSQEDVTFSANRLPAPGELRRLIDVLDHSEKPVLIHCKRGADRTGMTSAIVHLLYTDATVSQARRQLLPRYGHFEFGRTVAMDDFFDRYEAWLALRGVPHSPDRFRTWANTVYSPGPRVSKLELVDAVPNPVPADKPFAVRVRAVNRSAEPWHLKPGNYAGVHLAVTVAKFPDEALYRGQAGLMAKTVAPGESVVFTVVIPPLRRAGRFALVCEMTDATAAAVPIRANSFVQFGDEALLAEVVVEETEKKGERTTEAQSPQR